MSSSLRKAGDPVRAVAELENAIQDLLDRDWEETRRRRAHELADALAHAFPGWGLPEAAVVARSASCLLGLDPIQVRPIYPEVSEKLAELLALMSDAIASGRAKGTG
jgi:hypothetical protein